MDVEPEFYARPKDKKENPKRASGEPKHRWEVGRTEFKERETEIKNEQKPPRYDSKGRSLKAKPCGNVSVAFKERRAENKEDVRIHGQIPRSSWQKTAVHEFCEWKSHLNGVQNSRGMLAS